MPGFTTSSLWKINKLTNTHDLLPRTPRSKQSKFIIRTVQFEISTYNWEYDEWAACEYISFPLQPNTTRLHTQKTHTHTYTYIHTHTHTHIYIYIYAHTRTLARALRIPCSQIRTSCFPPGVSFAFFRFIILFPSVANHLKCEKKSRERGKRSENPAKGLDRGQRWHRVVVT